MMGEYDYYCENPNCYQSCRNQGLKIIFSKIRMRAGSQNIERNIEYKVQYDFPVQMAGEGRGPTVCEGCMGALAACLTQTMVGHATSRGIHLDSIDIDVVGDVDLRGITGISKDVRPGAQQLSKYKDNK